MLKNLPKIKHIDSQMFFLMAGPCIIENDQMAYDIAKKIKEITEKYKIPFIFKASYKKANRSRIDSFSGIGDEKALAILKDVGNSLDIPIVTDIHSVEEASKAAGFVDILQIPAFLCRQTELLVAASKTGKFVNIKKGQFLSPGSMKFAAKKVSDSGNANIILTERGNMYGYNDLVVDYRGIGEMQETGYPVVLDITHSLQQPNQESGISGGRPDLIETIARAGIAVGVDGIFLETHPNPKEAKSDGANMLPLDKLDGLLNNLVQLREVVNRLISVTGPTSSFK